MPTPAPDRPCGVNYTVRFTRQMDAGDVSRSIEYGTSMPDIQIRIANDYLDVAVVEHFLMAVIKDIKEKGPYTVARADEVAEQEKQAIRSGRLIPACPDGDFPF